MSYTFRQLVMCSRKTAGLDSLYEQIHNSMMLSPCLINTLSLDEHFNNCLIYRVSSNMQHTVTASAAAFPLDAHARSCVCVDAVRGKWRPLRLLMLSVWPLKVALCHTALTCCDSRGYKCVRASQCQHLLPLSLFLSLSFYLSSSPHYALCLARFFFCTPRLSLYFLLPAIVEPTSRCRWATEGFYFSLWMLK